MAGVESFKEKKQFVIIISVILISLLGLYLRFDCRVKSELWIDELQQIGTMSDSLIGAVIQARNYMQFPGDTIIIYPFSHLFQNNKWGLAIPHIIITIFGFYLLYLMCRKYIKTLAGYMATFLIFSFNANLIYHAFEIRPYSVLVTLSIAVFLVLQYIFERKTFSPMKRILISLFFFIAALFHLYGSFILFFTYLFHLFFSRKGEGIKEVLLRHFKTFGFVLFLIAPFWIYFAFADKSYMKHMHVNTFEFIPFGAVSLAKSIIGNLVGIRQLYVLLLGIVIAFLLPHRERFMQIAFFVLSIIVPIFLILIASVIYQYWFIQRLFIWTIPFFAFLTGWCWDSVILYFQKSKELYK